jgi:hypothetical protein
MRQRPEHHSTTALASGSRARNAGGEWVGCDGAKVERGKVFQRLPNSLSAVSTINQATL